MHTTNGLLGNAIDSGTTHSHGVNHDDCPFMKAQNGAHVVQAHLANGVMISSSKAISLSAPSLSLPSGGVGAGALASGAAASNVGTLGGDLSGTLPNPQVVSILHVAGANTLANAANDAAAAEAGVAVGHLYRNGSALLVRVGLMGRNWLRKCTVEVDGRSFHFDDKIRVRFETIGHTQQELSSAQIVLTNVSKNTASAFQREFGKVKLMCGYDGDRPAQIFAGDITEYQWGEKENNFTDTLLRVWARDGDTAYNRSRFRRRWRPDQRRRDIYDASLETLKPYGIAAGKVIGVDLSQPKFPRAFPLLGMTRDTMRELATNFGATWNINDVKLNVVAKGAAVPGTPIKLNAKTGMIGQPIVRLQGTIVSCLINPAIDVDTQVEIDAKSIVQDKLTNAGTDLSGGDGQRETELATIGANDGAYRVLHVRTECDTRGGP